jgi:integrase
MPRARTGTLVPPGADGIWRARVTKRHGDGTTSRPLYALGTTDKSLARRKLARLIASVEAGTDPAPRALNGPERVKDYASAWLAKREAQGVGMAPKERRNLELYVLEAIGNLPMSDVRASHVRSILDDAAGQGLKRASVAHVRGVLNRLFRAALEDETVEQNPVAAVRVPRMREVKKERAILTDAEFAKFIGCAAVDLELRMLSLVARCEGGMRTGDLHKWDWTQIDRVHFAECIVPRAKTGTPQALAIPENTRALRARLVGARRQARERSRVSCAHRQARRRNQAATHQLREAPAPRSVQGGHLPHVADRGHRDAIGNPNGSGQASQGHEARPKPARPAVLRDRDDAPRGLPLVPPRVRLRARRGRRQRPARDAPDGPFRSARARTLRDAHDGDAIHPAGGDPSPARGARRGARP